MNFCRVEPLMSTMKSSELRQQINCLVNSIYMLLSAKYWIAIDSLKLLPKGGGETKFSNRPLKGGRECKF